MLYISFSKRATDTEKPGKNKPQKTHEKPCVGKMLFGTFDQGLQPKPCNPYVVEYILYLCIRGKSDMYFSNNLLNVQAVISDRALPHNNNDEIDYYTADLLSATDYYPFGMVMAGRSLNTDDYRYGFNGKEFDQDWDGGEAMYDFGARIYDPRVARWLACDPKVMKYPDLTPYNFVANMPIWAIDPDGEDIVILLDKQGANHLGHQAVLIGNDKTGWTYISKDGTPNGTLKENLFGAKSRFVVTRFNTLDDFKNSMHNFNLADKSDGSHYYHSKVGGGAEDSKNVVFKLDSKGQKTQRYDDAFRITSDPKTDEMMLESAIKSASSDYKLTEADCSGVIDAALTKGGFVPGNDMSSTENASSPIPGLVMSIPRVKQPRIEMKNNGTDIDGKIIPSDTKLKTDEKGKKE